MAEQLKNSKNKIKPGDVFTIHGVNDKIAVGQVILREKHEIYIVVFEGLYNSEKEIKTHIVLSDKIAIVARTLDIFFKLGRWVVIDNLPVTEDQSIFPNYKINTVDGPVIVNFGRAIIRKATLEDDGFYFYYNSYSPAFVVGAIKAYNGLIPMDTDYEKLTYNFIKQRSNINN